MSKEEESINFFSKHKVLKVIFFIWITCAVMFSIIMVISAKKMATPCINRELTNQEKQILMEEYELVLPLEKIICASYSDGSMKLQLGPFSTCTEVVNILPLKEHEVYWDGNEDIATWEEEIFMTISEGEIYKTLFDVEVRKYTIDPDSHFDPQVHMENPFTIHIYVYQMDGEFYLELEEDFISNGECIRIIEKTN